MRSGKTYLDFGTILKVEPVEYLDGLDTEWERERGSKDQSFDVNKWKDQVTNN